MSKLIAIVPPGSGSGHGECFIWQSRNGAPIVSVDAGGAAGVGRRAGSYSPEILILSHDDNDHIRGAVDLITAAGQPLTELWVPVEWAILVKQLAETGPGDLLQGGINQVNTADLGAAIADQIATLADGDGGIITDRLLGRADENLRAWDAAGAGGEDGISIVDPTFPLRHWHGAKNLNEIINRVRKRADPLIRILSEACKRSIKIRFFSVDLAMSQARRTWETEGRPGVVTLANAVETTFWRALHIPTGLAYSFALTLLTVQNRRALSTLFWRDTTMTDGGAIIWSDTDGSWLDHSSPLGLAKVIQGVSVSSAPHHASSNAEHDRVWQELSSSLDDIVMINAGGHVNQGYRREYTDLQLQQRCCTWCRPNSRHYQEVIASSNTPGHWVLNNICQSQH